MARSRHAVRVHPLRSKGVVVGVPVAAAVAFGAHTVLGVTPLSDHQDAQASSSAPQAGAPVQSYGLAPTPPPTTLGLLGGPSTSPAPATDGSSSGTSHTTGTSGPQASTISGAASASSSAAHEAGSVPITRAAPAQGSAPSMMSFTPAAAPARAEAASVAAPATETHEGTAQPVRQAAAPAAHDDSAGQAKPAAPGGSLLGVDLGVAKVSVLSFGG